MYHLLLSLLLLPIVVTSELCEDSQYQYWYTCQNNTLSCPGDKRCTYVERCPAVVTLMARNALPAHRLRQAVCGYDRTRMKVCCSTDDAAYPDERPTFANREQYPTQSSSSLSSSSSPDCGKSLITNNADALGSYPFVARIGFVSKCSVLIGEYNTESDQDCNKLFCGRETSSHEISYVIKHPGYDAASFSNNVALLRLKKAIEFTATAQPICFIPEDRYVSLGSTCTVVGWGRLSSQKAQPTTQQSLQLKLVPKQQCSDYRSQGLSVELCAIGSCEPCSGYSGSPMLYKYADTYFLVGILSYGSSCDSTTIFPSAFVNVQRYSKWILENY